MQIKLTEKDATGALLCYAALECHSGTHDLQDGFSVGPFHQAEFAQNKRSALMRRLPEYFCFRAHSVMDKETRLILHSPY